MTTETTSAHARVMTACMEFTKIFLEVSRVKLITRIDEDQLRVLREHSPQEASAHPRIRALGDWCEQFWCAHDVSSLQFLLALQYQMHVLHMFVLVAAVSDRYQYKSVCGSLLDSYIRGFLYIPSAHHLLELEEYLDPSLYGLTELMETPTETIIDMAVRLHCFKDPPCHAG